MTEALSQLVGLLRARNDLDARVAQLTGRSARTGDIGEYIASQVFDIELAASAVQAGYDGRFRSGALAGRTVNIKTYGDVHDGLDMTPHACQYYLILSGARPASTASHWPWLLAKVYVFDARRLQVELESRGIKIGTATSLRAADLSRAEIFPTRGSEALLSLTDQQREQLSLFA